MNKTPLNNPADDKLAQPRAPIDWSAVRSALAQANSNTQAILNPSPERIADIFAERARELAREKATVTTRQWCELTLFDVGVQQFAIETRYLRGVAETGSITPLPGVPQYLLGLTSYKGDIVAVIDPALLMNQQPVSSDSGNCLLLLGEQSLEFALLVNAVAGQWTVAQDDIRPFDGAVTTATAAGAATVIESLGLVTNPGSTRATTVLNGAALLADERLYFTV